VLLYCLVASMVTGTFNKTAECVREEGRGGGIESRRNAGLVDYRS